MSDSSIPKLAQDVALGSARMSVAFASICFALLKIEDSPNFTAPIPKFWLLLLGVVFVFHAARTIDWLIDQLPYDDWERLLGNKSDILKWDQIIARIRLFNGGYFILVIALSALIFAFMRQAVSYIGYGQWLPIIIAAIFSIYVFGQMTTHKWVGLRIGWGALILAMGLILGRLLPHT